MKIIDKKERSDTQQLTFGKKLAWGSGGMADALMTSTIFALAMPIYNIAIGVSPVLIGYALAIPRLWDAITDPLVGNLSDNTRSRFGRRRPYIFVGAIFSGILFAIMWMPPTGLTQFGFFLYLTISSILFFTAYTFYVVPWTALGYELSTDYNERTKVMAYRAFLASLAAAVFLPWPYKLCFVKLFGNNEIEGVRIVGVIYGVAMAILGIIPAIFCRERTQSHRPGKIPILKSIKLTFKNRAFIVLSGIVLTVVIGVFLVNPLQTYIFIFHIFKGNKAQGATMSAIFQTSYNALSMLVMPLIVRLAAKWGKKRTLQMGLFLLICGYISTSWAFNSQYPYLALVICLFNCPGLACVWVLTSSMLADICDIDELNTGLRREGMYGGIFSWVFKLGIASVIAISGLMVKLSGFDAALGVNQDPDSIFNLRVLYAIGPTIFIIIALILTKLFPVTEQQMRQARVVLDQRKCSSL